MALTRVFEPIRIGNVEIPNRIVRAAHGTHLARHAFDEDSIAYHTARAKGGCGLTIIEAIRRDPPYFVAISYTNHRIPGSGQDSFHGCS